MNYKGENGYEVLYPKTNLSVDQMTWPFNGMNQELQMWTWPLNKGTTVSWTSENNNSSDQVSIYRAIYSTLKEYANVFWVFDVSICFVNMTQNLKGVSAIFSYNNNIIFESYCNSIDVSQSGVYLQLFTVPFFVTSNTNVINIMIGSSDGMINVPCMNGSNSFSLIVKNQTLSNFQYKVRQKLIGYTIYENIGQTGQGVGQKYFNPKK